jgi:hypothetical protein
MATVSFAPAVVDLVGVRAGDRNSMSIVVSQDGAPLNITGAVITAQVRKLATDPDPAVLEAEIQITDAAAGAFTVSWPGDDVRALLGSAASWSGRWDCQVALGGADPTTIAAGRFEAEVDVTR